MNIRPVEQGVVLVITLIMLSVVTVMTVLFLGVSRRERAAVTVTTDLIMAKAMAESAVARAQSEIVSRMLTSSNKLNYDFAVSTNFLNPDGFDPNIDEFNPTNVTGLPLDERYHQAVNIGNLQFDPRPPVYIQSSSSPSNSLDFRYYLDFNRNGAFEPSGLLTISNQQTKLIGDPQWIGVLEHPNQPHSATNKFIGRFAYLILPTGKSLDLNAIHNQIKKPGATDGDYFVRNQGVGPWEINLAAFLADLNYRWWGYSSSSYQQLTNPQNNVGGSFDHAFSLLSYRINPLEELPVLDDTLSNLGLDLGVGYLHNDYVDFFANGPYLGSSSWLTNDLGDSPGTVYWGGDLRRAYYDVQELFDTNKVEMYNLSGDGFATHLRESGSRDSDDDYHRYTFYRLLSQMGVDSRANERARTMSLTSSERGQPMIQESRMRKLHLNYDIEYNTNAPTTKTNFKEWNGIDFFIAAADRLLRASIITNPPDFAITNAAGQRVSMSGTNFFIMGDTYVHRNFSITNIQVWPRVVPQQRPYSANVHQQLQIAANIADVTAAKTDLKEPMQKFPLVFRPRFQLTNDPGQKVVIFNYVEVTNDAPRQIANRPWRDLEEMASQGQLKQLQPDDNVWGIPWVIAAKKGLPNFNEFGILTTLEMTRKLEINKGGRNAPREMWQTNQMVTLSISNLCGLECWNSYTQAYRRPLQIQALVDCSLLITNEYRTLIANKTTTNTITTTPAGAWLGQQFKLPVFTDDSALKWNFSGQSVPVASAIYDHPDVIVGDNPTGRLIPIFPFNRNYTNFLFPDSGGFPVGRIGLAMTNRIRCVMIDVPSGRIVDFVNLGHLVSNLDITEELMGEDALSEQPGGVGKYWSARRLGHLNDVRVPTEGIIEQIFTSLGEIHVSSRTWNSYVGRGAGHSREEAIDLFRVFLGLPPRYLSRNALADAYLRLRDPRKSFRRQVPFSPSIRKSIYQTWQANDPLVHYTVEDLQDNEQLSSQKLFMMPGQQVSAEQLHNFGNLAENSPGQVNKRYRPWPSHQGDVPLKYNMAYKDPLIRQSDDWQFPTNKFPNIGWLGRVHRGTPWQTIYLKAYLGMNGEGRLLTANDLPAADSSRFPGNGTGHPFETVLLSRETEEPLEPTTEFSNVGNGVKANSMASVQENWFRWSGSYGTHPTNDWKILEQFTTALHDNGSKGLLSVNQAGLAAWSAVLSGVTVQTNMSEHSIAGRDFGGLQPAEYRAITIKPAGDAGYAVFLGRYPAQSPLTQIVNGDDGINTTRERFPGGRFRYLGEVLATPALTVQSPFLNWRNTTVSRAGLNDFAVERIPQQVLSLLKADEPRVTIYAYGQSLRPADQSLRLEATPARLFNLCTNYQITGEFALKRVVHFDGPLNNMKAVVESEIVIPID